MMIYGLMKLKVTLLELFILKSDPFGLFTSKVICHRNGSLNEFLVIFAGILIDRFERFTVMQRKLETRQKIMQTGNAMRTEDGRHPMEL